MNILFSKLMCYEVKEVSKCDDLSESGMSQSVMDGWVRTSLKRQLLWAAAGLQWSVSICGSRGLIQ